MPHDTFRLRFQEPQMMAGGEEAEINIYSEICSDGWKWSAADMSATDFDKAIKGIKGASKLTLHINSPGGEVFQAVAMRSILVSAAFPELVIMIDGMCASAATLIACVPGAKVIMAPGAQYMIHNPMSGIHGNASQMEKCAQRLRSEEKDFRAMYAKRCGKEDKQIQKWMDEETWFTSSQAVENGFADEVAQEDEEAMVACVSPDVMEAMQGVYTHIPETVMVADAPAIQEPDNASAPQNNTDTDTANPVSTECPTHAAVHPTEHKEHKEEHSMDIKDMTAEQLRTENPGLYESIMHGGSDAERQRIQDIDAITLPGYEDMADKAKADGTSAFDFQKMLVKAQKDKAAQFLKDRANETATAKDVKGGASDDKANEEADIDKFAKEVADYAKQDRSSVTGGMF